MTLYFEDWRISKGVTARQNWEVRFALKRLNPLKWRFDYLYKYMQCKQTIQI